MKTLLSLLTIYFFVMVLFVFPGCARTVRFNTDNAKNLTLRTWNCKINTVIAFDNNTIKDVAIQMLEDKGKNGFWDGLKSAVGIGTQLGAAALSSPRTVNKSYSVQSSD